MVFSIIFLEDAIIYGVTKSSPFGGLCEPSTIFLHIAFNLHHFQLSGIVKGISSSIFFITFPTFS